MHYFHFQREDTLEFVRMIERCGVSAIGVHGRRKDERPANKNRLDEIHEIARLLNIPVITKYFKSIFSYLPLQFIVEINVSNC